MHIVSFFHLRMPIRLRGAIDDSCSESVRSPRKKTVQCTVFFTYQRSRIASFTVSTGGCTLKPSSPRINERIASCPSFLRSGAVILRNLSASHSLPIPSCAVVGSVADGGREILPFCF